VTFFLRNNPSNIKTRSLTTPTDREVTENKEKVAVLRDFIITTTKVGNNNNNNSKEDRTFRIRTPIMLEGRRIMRRTN
jgi:hypothetical protein